MSTKPHFRVHSHIWRERTKEAVTVFFVVLFIVLARILQICLITEVSTKTTNITKKVIEDGTMLSHRKETAGKR